MASIMTLYSSKAFPYHQFTVAADFKSVRKCVVDAAYVNATSTYTDIKKENEVSQLSRKKGVSSEFIHWGSDNTGSIKFEYSEGWTSVKIHGDAIHSAVVDYNECLKLGNEKEMPDDAPIYNINLRAMLGYLESKNNSIQVADCLHKNNYRRGREISMQMTAYTNETYLIEFYRKRTFQANQAKLTNAIRVVSLPAGGSRIETYAPKLKSFKPVGEAPTNIATIIGYEERYSDLARCAGELTPEK